MSHDNFTLAKAAAYSGILSLFPALLVVTSVLAMTPDTDAFRGELRAAFDEVLPYETMDVVESYFQDAHSRSLQLVWSASVVTFLAAMGVTLTFMEGFRRAYRLPRGTWGFWHTRLIAIGLIPICMVPMVFATLLVAFGHPIENWMIDKADHVLRNYVIVGWRILRWSIALGSAIAVLATIYRFGTPHIRRWRHILPGAATASATWFLATLLYGWYVTHAQYTLVYGSLAAAVATLVWLYITSLSVLIGAEFNAQIFPLEGSQPGEGEPASDEILMTSPQQKRP
jgi:membrane protein